MSSIHLKYIILGIGIVLVAANIVWSAGSSRAQTKTNRSQSSKTSNSQSSKTSNSQSSKTSTRARNDVGNKTGWSKKLLGTMLLLLTLPGTLSPLNLAVASGTGGGGSLANGNGLVQYNNLLCEPYMEAGHKYLRCQTKLDNVDSQKKLDIYATNAKNRKRNWERIGKVDLKGCAMGKPKTGKNDRKGKKQEETCEKSVQIRKEQVQKVMNMTNQISPAWRNIHLKHANNKRTKSIKPGGRRALLQADRQVSITVVNSCDYNTWPNLISGDSRFVGGNTPDSWAFPNLHKGDSYTVSMPANTAAVNLAIQMACNDDGTGCTSAACTDASGNSVRCPKGAGGSNPKTQIEWTFNGDKNQDFYDISLVNGQNVVAKVTPANGNCPSIAKCDLLAAANQLPAEMVVKDPNGYPYLVKGFCDAFPSDPSMCCTGAYGTSPACKPVFETPGGKAYQWWTAESSVCPHDYLYAYMDSAATYTCDNSQVQNPGYTVELCPAS